MMWCEREKKKYEKCKKKWKEVVKKCMIKNRVENYLLKFEFPYEKFYVTYTHACVTHLWNFQHAYLPGIGKILAKCKRNGQLNLEKKLLLDF